MQQHYAHQLLTLEEIKPKAQKFASEWSDYSGSEQSGKHDFLTQFFELFGINRKQVAVFEARVKGLKGGRDGFMDLFWPGKVLIEMKGPKEKLDRALNQALNYLDGLSEVDKTRYILLSNFKSFRLIDLEHESDHPLEYDIHISDLADNLSLFGFMQGEPIRQYKAGNPVDVEAAFRFGSFRKGLLDRGYPTEDLPRLLTRLLFCLFAEDSGIFKRFQVEEIIRTSVDEKADTGALLLRLFRSLDQESGIRDRLGNEYNFLKSFPYVNGPLFKGQVEIPDIDADMATSILDLCELDWSAVSPAIFGSMFQAALESSEKGQKTRSELGAHYTSEQNILKAIDPLYMDDLRDRFQRSYDNHEDLLQLRSEIAKLKILDPACGCGNFLVVAYRELRALEDLITQKLTPFEVRQKNGGLSQTKIDFDKTSAVAPVATNLTIDELSLNDIAQVELENFYGMDIDETATHIARVAMFLVDHQCNNQTSAKYGKRFLRLPLNNGAKIHCVDALKIGSWTDLLDKQGDAFNYIIGNPPFMGSKRMTDEMRKQVQIHFVPELGASLRRIEVIETLSRKLNEPIDKKALKDAKKKLKEAESQAKGAKTLDYVSAWFLRSSAYMAGNPHCKTALVATNSIIQGEQVALLWNQLFDRYSISISFAHQSFKWFNEASGLAQVHCVIIGFQSGKTYAKRSLYTYTSVKSDYVHNEVEYINPYLRVDKIRPIASLEEPISEDAPTMHFGNMPLDKGYLSKISTPEKSDMISKFPVLEPYLKRLLGADEFLDGSERWCLWLVDAPPNVLAIKPVAERILATKEIRESSSDSGTRNHAIRPSQFRDTRNPESFLLIPRTTSGIRSYVPFAFFDASIIPSDATVIIPEATPYHFGVLQSRLHQAWFRYVCGNLKGDVRYSKNIVYNNFPWPENVSDAQKTRIERLASVVLSSRELHPNESLINLYGKASMPSDLAKAHAALDKAVDQLYQAEPFENDNARVMHLFKLHADLTGQPTLL